MIRLKLLDSPKVDRVANAQDIRPKAKIIDKKTNAKLKVTFFWPFYGDYWILDLGPNYEYAVAGEPGRKYLWILSRSLRMDEALYQQLLRKWQHEDLTPR